MASRVEQNIAKKVLAMHQGRPKGENSEVRAAARRVLQGTGTAADLASIRSFLGIRRTGMRGAKQVQGRAFGIQRAATNIARDFQIAAMSSTGGRASLIATANLTATVTRELEGLTKSKFIGKTAERVAGFLGRHPADATRFLKTLGRGLKWGGFVGTSAFVALKFAQDTIDRKYRMARSTTAIRDISRKMDTDPRFTKDIEKQVRKTADRLGILKGVKQHERFASGIAESPAKYIPIVGANLQAYNLASKWMSDYFEESHEAKVKELMEKEVGARMKGRGVLEELGIDRSTVLGAYAARRGLRVQDLTTREVNEALDAELKDKLNPRTTKYLRSAYVRSQMDLLTPLQKSIDAAYIERKRAHEEEFALEAMVKTVNSAEKKKADRAEAARQLRERMTPAERFLQSDMIARANANWIISMSSRNGPRVGD